MTNTDTIFALSSGAGKSGVAVIRISGDELESVFSNLVRLAGFIQPRHAYLTNLIDDAGATIDQCVAIYFQGPSSFTGQDVIEIHSHGSPAVIQKIFETLRRHGMRMATPGEFSKRAFYNNKMDLVEIDALAALLDARTDRQRTHALKSMMGADSEKYQAWRSAMIEISAYAAAILDYPSDELPANIGDKLIASTQKLYNEINTALSRYFSSRAVRSGFNIVLTGETNVGKSSLFNCLVGESRAIVTDIPGTTRDVVSHQLDIDGYLINLSDTAGIRDSIDPVEKIGIEKTHAEILNADLIIKVFSNQESGTSNKNNEIVIINKCDLLDTSGLKPQTSNLYVSALTGAGIDELMELIKQKIHEKLDGTESDIAINERTRVLLIDAANELKSAIAADNHDIFAEHVRAAADGIGMILGAINATEVMDATFGQLCLGK